MTRRILLLSIISILLGQTARSQSAFHKVFNEDKFYLYGINQSYCPITINLSIDSLGLETKTTIRQPGDTTLLLVMDRGAWNEEADLSPYLKASLNFGDPKAKPSRFQYALPFAKGAAFECIQGFKSDFSHNKKSSAYAVDFKMPEGTPVHAARAGTVVYLKENNQEGGKDKQKYLDKANTIMIYHEDGTVASYDHLQYQGALVEVGQKVKKGELIGYSGNTGFSTTPHLHFVVRILDRSIKIRFEHFSKPKKSRIYQH